MKKTLLIVVGMCALGCAHYPAPTDQLAKSIAAVRGAEEAGAPAVPAAALHMKLAREQIDQAKQMMANDDNRRAEDKAVRAAQDAELAIALARDEAAAGKLSQFQQSGGAGGEAPPAAGAQR